VHDWTRQGLTQEKAKRLVRSFTHRYLENRPMHIYAVTLDSIRVIEMLCAALNSGTLPQGKGGVLPSLQRNELSVGGDANNDEK
jgi:hypothetical protein